MLFWVKTGLVKVPLSVSCTGYCKRIQDRSYGAVRSSRGCPLARARQLGIGMVFQHFSLFEPLSVLENIALAVDSEHHMGCLAERIIEVSASYGLPLNPHAHVFELSVGERQRIEIVRCLLQNPRFLILDEPTSVLTPQEVARLFITLQKLSKEGCAILYISHKLEEVRALCHHATVLRQGRVVGECESANLSTGEKEADATKALIDQGADIITQHTDSPAPLQVAENSSVFGFGQASDNINFAPKAQLTAVINNWDSYYVARTKAVMDGSWKSEDVWGGLKAGMVSMARYTNMPADVSKLAKKTEVAISSGKLHPFQGPVISQDGKVMAVAGSVIDDGTLLGMDWYVEGVEGKLPKKGE